MKRKKLKPVEIRTTPPPGWPSEEVWADAERQMRGKLPSRWLPANAGPVAITKQRLCERFIIYSDMENITQRELARRLGVTESRVSEILHYHHDHFTIDRLLELLNKIKPGVILKIA